MTERHLILATAGHIDHGKTALVRALTGIDTDRLPEEKARGITIDLGFAHLALPACSLGIIDVPGHEDFIRNMIAGVGSIDLALLVVAADDGWMPQTEEHLQILEYLDVRRGVVAISKSDLGGGEKTREEVQERLRGSSLGKAPVVLTSVRDPASLDLLQKAIAQECAHLTAPRDSGKPRLFVDRAFTVRGAGTVVTGTLTGGQLAAGQAVLLQPQNVAARIRALQNHHQPVATAQPGMRVALNLPDLRPEEIPRGTVVTSVETRANDVLDVVLERSARESLRAPRLRNGSSVHLHFGSAHTTAAVRLLDAPELTAGARVLARLRLDAPLLAFASDRFIVRDSSAQQTIAGGCVLDPDAAGTAFGAAEHCAFLRERATAPNDLRILLQTQLRRDHFVTRDELLVKSPFSRAEISAAVDELCVRGEIFQGHGIVADAAWWHALAGRAAKEIDAHHAAHSDHAGVELTELQALLRVRDSRVFEALSDTLAKGDFVRRGTVLRRRTHRPSLPRELENAGAAIRDALARQPLDPPSRKELLRGNGAREALRFLVEAGEVILLGDDLALSAAAFAQMQAQVRGALQTRGAATTSELRQLLGTTRRVLVPVLERLDQIGLTMRQGDRRTLKGR